MKRAKLILESGKYFDGMHFGQEPPDIAQFERMVQNTISSIQYFSGEVVFNTAMSGYVEVLSDPSFSGQLICMTYPHIGNYGVDVLWSESSAMLSAHKSFPNSSEGIPIDDEQAKAPVRNKNIMASGFIVKDLYQGPVPQGRLTLDAWMQQENICGIAGIDTRALTLYLRNNGNENGAILMIEDENFESEYQKALELIKKIPSMEGRNIVKNVSLSNNYFIANKHRDVTSAQVLKVGILDFGCKHNIIRLFEQRNCAIILFSANATAEEITKNNIDLLIVSNGPGDPAVLKDELLLLSELIGTCTICGICLGTQLLALSIGAKTYKLPFGHHGINHPVVDLKTDKLYITSQNHGFAVDENSLPEGAAAWFRNTNDQTLEGFIHQEKKMYSVQFHPEAAPGPSDTTWIIDYYIEQARRNKTEE